MARSSHCRPRSARTSKSGIGRNAIPVTVIAITRSARHILISPASSERPTRYQRSRSQSSPCGSTSCTSRSCASGCGGSSPRGAAPGCLQETCRRRPDARAGRSGGRAAVKYVIRLAFDADDARPVRQDLAGGLRKRGKELRLRRFEVAFERRRLKPADQRQRDEERRRLHAVQRDRRREIVAGKPETALRAALRLDRDAERDQPVDVPVDGPDRYLETRRELGRRKQLPAASEGAGSRVRAPADSQDSPGPIDHFYGPEYSLSILTSRWQVSHPIPAPQTEEQGYGQRFNHARRRSIVDRLGAWFAAWVKALREVRARCGAQAQAQGRRRSHPPRHGADVDGPALRALLWRRRRMAMSATAHIDAMPKAARAAAR